MGKYIHVKTVKKMKNYPKGAENKQNCVNLGNKKQNLCSIVPVHWQHFLKTTISEYYIYFSPFPIPPPPTQTWNFLISHRYLQLKKQLTVTHIKKLVQNCACFFLPQIKLLCHIMDKI